MIQQQERKGSRRKAASSHFTSPHNDRRRPQFERRGTVPQKPAPTREQLVYGERRVLPDAGLE
jgi:hypothetical protein